MRAIERFSLLALCLLLLVTFPGQTSFGQAVYGSIFGTVTDAQGAAVPNAKVIITEPSKNVSVTVETNADGNYTYNRLIPGTYRVKVEAQNFKSSIQENVIVSVDTGSQVNIQLQAGAVTEEITVTAEAPLLKTDRADVATTFESKQVTELPILDRNYTKFLLLTPGTSQLGWQHASSENPQGSVQIIVNGQPFHGTSFQLDGTDNRDPILGIIVINPTLESVTESKITSQNYDAEFGVATAGVATAQTRSGSNDFNGAVFIFRRNDKTSARNPFSQSNGIIPDTLWNQFGGRYGGRIIKDKLFFFGDYQGTRRKNGGSVLTTVPTALARTGNLSEYGVNIFDPQSATGTQLAPAQRSQFQDGGVLNKIPAARLNAAALKLINQLPLPNRPGLAFNYAASGIEAFDSDQWNTREDWYYSQRMHIFGRYSYARFERRGPGAFGDLVGGPAFDNIFFAGQSKVRNDSVAGGFDYTVRNNLLTDFRFGFFRYKVNVLPNGVGTKPAADAGIPGLNNDDFFTSGMPAFYINEADGQRNVRFGYALGVNQCNCPLDQNEKQVQFVNNWTVLAGNHNYKFGADIRHARNLRVPSDSHRAGELGFNRERTAGPSGGGSGLAAFLIGDVSNLNRYVSTSTDARERQNRQFFYGQDTWRVNSKLTINYGLRWELVYPEYLNKAGNGGFLDIRTGEIIVAGAGGNELNGNVENNFRHLAPRLGIAYQWNDKTVVRLGYGRSYDIGVFGSVFGHAVTQNLPVLASQSLNPANNFDRVFNFAQGAPAFTQFFGLNKLPKDPTAVANTSLPSNGRFFLPNGVFARLRPEKMKLPTLDAWNLTIQHQLTPSLSVDAAYVGNKGTNTFTDFAPAFNINQARIEGFRAQNDPRGPGLSFNQRQPYFSLFGWTQGIDFFANAASSNYHALQTKATQRLSKGLTILAHYTWSKAFNYTGDYFPINANLAYGPTDTDRTHVFVASTTWDLPFGNNFTGAAKTFLGGWQINQITNWSSGLPFTPYYGSCGDDRDTGPCRPNLAGSVSTGATRAGDGFAWFTTAGGGLPRAAGASAFTSPGPTVGPWQRPTPGTFGNAPRNSLRGPRFFNTDLSVFKNFRFTERVNAQFRTEFFNIFNNVNLGQPDGNVERGSSSGQIFGIAAGANMRQIQFGLRVEF